MRSKVALSDVTNTISMSILPVKSIKIKKISSIEDIMHIKRQILGMKKAVLISDKLYV